MGGGPDIPEPSPEERRLQASQAELLDLQKSIALEQIERDKLFEPILLKQAGLEKVMIEGAADPALQAELQAAEQNLSRLRSQRGSAPNLSGFYDKAISSEEKKISELRQSGGEPKYELRETPLARKLQDVQLLQLDRTEKALRGELPIDEGLLSDLADQQSETEQRLAATLGPGYATSTAGQNALEGFGQFRSSVLDRARRGDIAQLLPYARSFGPEAPQTAQAPGAAFSLLSGTAGGYGAAAEPYQRLRELQFQADAQKQDPLATILGGVIGAGLGAFTGGVGLGAAGAIFPNLASMGRAF